MDLIDLVVLRTDDVKASSAPNNCAVDGESGAEQGNAGHLPLRQTFAVVKKIDHGEGDLALQLPSANVRRDGGNGKKAAPAAASSRTKPAR